MSILQKLKKETKLVRCDDLFPQITFNVYQYDTKLNAHRLAGSCQLYGIYITSALK